VPSSFLTEELSQLKLELQKYDTAIAVVQEVRWNDEGITDRGYFYCFIAAVWISIHLTQDPYQKAET
jgi:hypothetical protein